jgi:integrase
MDEPQDTPRWSTKRTSTLPRGVYTKAGSPFYWIRYSEGRKNEQNKTLVTTEVTEFRVGERGALRKAEQLVQDRRAAVRKGEAPVLDKTLTFEAMMRSVIAWYEFKEHRSTIRQRQHIANLSSFFTGKRAQDIDADMLREYVAFRRASTFVRRRRRRGPAITRVPSNSTINGELRCLRRGFYLNKGKIARIPTFELLTEDNVRDGFFERHELDAVLPELPEWMRGAVEFMYITGWRVNSEVLTRQWKHVDFKAGWVVLEPGVAKNKEARMFPLTTHLRDALTRQREYVKGLEREHGKVIPWMFPKDDGEPCTYMVKGKEVFKWHYDAWEGACKRAKIGEKLAHDFRRTAVRNLVRSGIQRRTAMKMTGHKTESVFERYNIQDEADLEDAGRKLDVLLDTQAGAAPKVVPLKKEG